MIAAFGVLAALASSFTLLPLCLVRIPQRGAQLASAHLAWGRALELVVAGALRRSRLVLGGTLALCAIAGVGLAKLRVEVDVYHLFGEETRVVRWIRFVEERLRKPDTLDVELTLPESRRLEDPEVLAALSEVSRSLAALPGLGPARSLSDPLRWLNRILHADAPAFERPAASRPQRQLLRLLARHDPQALARWVSPTRDTPVWRSRSGGYRAAGRICSRVCSNSGHGLSASLPPRDQRP